MLQPKLVCNVGGMFASKSTALIAQGQRHMLAGHKVVYVKPAMDNRYSDDEIVTHDGKKVRALKVRTDGGILSFHDWLTLFNADVILIDEIQFFDLKFVDDLNYFLMKGKVIYTSGLDMDFRGIPFPVTAHLMGMADEVIKYKAVCSNCGNDGYVTVKTSGSNDRLELGSKEKYQPVCRPCFYKFEEAN